MHPIELYTNKFKEQKVEYIHENPVVAGIVYEPQQYVYSSAIDYYDNRKGGVTITYLE